MNNPFGKTINFYDKTLPNILETLGKEKITNVRDWESKRRKEILPLFEKNVYGHAPLKGFKIHSKVISEKEILGGIAVKKQIELTITTRRGSKKIKLLFYFPKKDRLIPVISILNFHGNHTVDTDPEIPLVTTHIDFKKSAITRPRGSAAKRWPIERILNEGFGILTASKEEFSPDVDGESVKGIQELFSKRYSWGTICAWSWGLSRMVDFLETEKRVDKSRLIVMGLSRLGKAALWAGARDKRFKLIISINSGGSGASLSRSKGGEAVKDVNTGKPFWFCKKYKEYNDRERYLPIDQHMLIAVMAPRYVYVSSSEKDAWANPKGEFISCMLAEPAFRLYGKNGLGTKIFPQLNSPISIGNIGYHIRKGGHGLNLFDWNKCVEFANRKINR